jgi:hypothetical protein
MSHILNANGIPQYDEVIYADLVPPDIHKNIASSVFIVGQGIDGGKNKGRIFELDHGKCFSHYRKGGRLHTEEYLYTHFQRRPLRVGVGVDENHFLLVPGARVVPAEPVTKGSLNRFVRHPRLVGEWFGYLIDSIKRGLVRQGGLRQK